MFFFSYTKTEIAKNKKIAEDNKNKRTMKLKCLYVSVQIFGVL